MTLGHENNCSSQASASGVMTLGIAVLAVTYISSPFTYLCSQSPDTPHFDVIGEDDDSGSDDHAEAVVLSPVVVAEDFLLIDRRGFIESAANADTAILVPFFSAIFHNAPKQSPPVLFSVS